MVAFVAGLVVALLAALLYFADDDRRWHRGRMQMFGAGQHRHY